MAQYTPRSWKASPEASAKFSSMYAALLKQVTQRARKYFSLSAISGSDLIQEGLIAALYAIDSYQPTRGKLEAYIGTLVDNALGMIAQESRSQCRQPYTWVKMDDEIAPSKGTTLLVAPENATPPPKKPPQRGVKDGWRQVAAFEAVDPDMVEASATFTISEYREERLAKQARCNKELNRLASIRASLSELAAQVFDLRCTPPVDLLIIARNLVGRTVTDKARMPNKAIAQYLGVEVSAVDRAVKELRSVLDAQYPEKAAISRARSRRHDTVLREPDGLSVCQESHH